ncbi:hypothetical protein [Streptodolium elevatio]|uniref:Uncharacterized protein n=1 Tax=Streptodolium elevatio TaxID=3157996 RepID=A0ABV3D8W5_9ACTN
MESKIPHAHSARVGSGNGSPLDIVRDAFTLLITGPMPLAVDGRAFPGLPERTIALDELRDLLLRRRCPLATRDAVWAHLASRARAAGGIWTVACVGMALPALAPVCRWMGARFPGDPSDIHAEIMAGFLRGLATTDLDRPGIIVRMRWVAFRAGHAALYEALDAPTPVASAYRSFPPPPPWGHPDLVLARAIRWGVITQTEADLIGTTRLDRVPITDWAASRRTTLAAAYKARSRAESRLAAFLRDEVRDADREDPVGSQVRADLAPTTDCGDDGPRVRTRSVTDTQGSPKEPRARSSRESTSNGAPRRGLSSRGGTPPTASSGQEVRRCA